MIVGYARVSTQDQNLQGQIEAIEEYAKKHNEECVIYQEKESGGKKDRAELQNALKAVREGDKFVIYKLDRLARSSKQLFDVADELEQKGVEFISISDNIDTTTATGKAMFGMLSVFAEFERAIIRERTRAGLQSAKKRGKIGGRPSLDDKTKKRINILFNEGESAKDIAKEYGIGRSTVYKIVNELKEGESE